MEGPLLWFLNRGTGVALLLLLTTTTVLGVLSTRAGAGRGLPQFVTQALHRNLSLLAVLALAAHVVTAVVDEYVDIAWWHAVVPGGSTYQPLWLGVGALALDLMLVVVLTSAVRHLLPHGPWKRLHLLAYLAWGLGVAHTLGMGTDARSGWLWWPTLGCVAVVGAAALVRARGLLAQTPHQGPVSTADRAAVSTGGAR